MDDAFPATELRLVRLNPLAVVFFALGSLGIALQLVGLALEWFELPQGYLLPLFLFGAASMIQTRRPRYQPILVTADALGLHLGARLLPRAELRAGFVAPRTEGSPRVVLHRRLRPQLQIQVADAAQGRRLLHALHLDVTRTAARFWAIPRGRANLANTGLTALLWVISLVAFAGGGGLDTPALAWLVPKLGLLGIALSFAVLLVPSRLIVASEGVALRWLGHRRFFRYDALARAETFRGQNLSGASGVRLVLGSGERVAVPIGTSTASAERVAIIVERIREAMTVYRQRAAGDGGERLDRGGRSLKDWVVRLRALGVGANAAFREAPLPRERLFDLAEDPGADLSTRAAAAVALGAALDDPTRERLRAAASATAIPALRITLERAAGGAESEAIEEALAEVEAAEQGSPRAAARRAP